MTEKKTKGAKPNFFVRFGQGFVGFFKRIGLAFKNMWHELRKVTWPPREKLVNYSVIVVLFMLFMICLLYTSTVPSGPRSKTFSCAAFAAPFGVGAGVRSPARENRSEAEDGHTA